MADIQQQLATLLGRETVQIWKTDENPARVSVIDVIAAITGKSHDHASKHFRRIAERHDEVRTNCPDFRFRGRGQRDTPVTGVRGIVEVIMLLPGQQSARVRRQAAELLCRYLGEDLALVDEVCAIRGFQGELAIRAPEDPRRLFGEAVEASSSRSPAPRRGARRSRANSSSAELHALRLRHGLPRTSPGLELCQKWSHKTILRCFKRRPRLLVWPHRSGDTDATDIVFRAMYLCRALELGMYTLYRYIP